MSVIKVNNITNLSGTSGPVIAGIATVSTTSHMVVPTGNTGQKVPLAPDPYIDNLVLALPFNSESVFDDISPKGNHPAPAGIGTTTASLPFGVSGVTTTSSGIVTFSKYYGTSAYFDGNGDFLNVVNGGNFDFGIDDFTIEAWVYLPSATATGGLVSTAIFNTSGWTFEINGNTINGVFGFMPAPYQNRIESPTGSYAANTWTHLAITRSSGTLYMFSNGTVVKTQTGVTYNISNNQVLTVGQYGPNWDARYFLNGYIQDLRIYKGVAKYTSNFTPPNQIAL